MKTLEREIKPCEALELFRGWFNNKMTVVVFKIQCAASYRRAGRQTDVQPQLIFLDDLLHHFARRGIDGRGFTRAVKWLKAFFRIYPGRVSERRCRKAWRMLEKIYDGIGLEYPFLRISNQALPSQSERQAIQK